MFNIIPAIDLLDGQVVRLTKGNYNNKQDYNFTPRQLAQHYVDQGAKRIHIVDLNGAKDGYLVNKNALLAIRESVDCELEIGGGIRSLDQANELLDMGYNYLILGSLLIKNFDLAKSMVFGCKNKVYAGLDCKNEYLATQGWEENSSMHIFDMLKLIESWPLAGIIATDIETDGTLLGPNLNFIEKLCQATRHQLIASGGIGSENDVLMLKEIDAKNLYGCITGKAILEDKVCLKTLIKQCLRDPSI